MKKASMTIGCDLGDRSSEYVVLNARGQVTLRRKFPTTRAGLQKEFGGRKRARIVVEAGSHSCWVSEACEKMGHEVVVANPRQVRLIHKSRNKSDRLDAERLARLGRFDIELLAPIRHRSSLAQADLAQVRARDGLVRSRTSLVNCVRGLLKPFGLRLPACSPEALPKRAVAVLELELQVGSALKPMLAAIEAINAQIKAFDREIKRLVNEAYLDAARLAKIPGVGEITALTFVLTLHDPKRFKCRDVAAYLGLVPRRDQSGEDDKELRITKAGNSLLRRLLVQCAQYIVGPFAPESDLRTWGLGLAARGGRNAKKRAIVAVARKLTMLLHSIWTTSEEYQPMRLTAKAA